LQRRLDDFIKETAAVWADVVLDSGNYAAAWTWLVAAILFAGCK
jgi:hypothetical protein